jgi:hypothetical protein
VTFAEAEWLKDKSSPFWRRTIIRCCCAWVEGTTSVLKKFAPEVAEYGGVKLNKKDLEVVNELRTDKKSGLLKTAFLPPDKNIKKTFKLFTKARRIQKTIKYNDSRFKDLCDTFELRNGLMHPKEPRDLEVSEKALDAADRGVNWFGEKFKEVFGSKK